MLFALAPVVPSNEARAAEEFDPKEELAYPGPRLLVVEFYSIDCKPCMAAVPKWNALRAKYRSKGLRLVVVKAEHDGRCVNLAWSRDRSTCDEDDQSFKSMRVKSLPSAFVWSWTGELLVNGGHVEQGEQVIEGELAKMPRVAIHLKGSEKGLPEAERFVRAELNRAGKLQAEATAAEVKAIEAVQRASMGTERDEKAQYAIGKTLGANSILTLSVGKSASTSSESFVDRDTGIIETHVRSYGTRSRQGLLGSSPPLRARRGTRHLARCYGQVRRRDPKRRSLYVQCTHTSNYEATSVPIFVGAPGVRARPHP